jgi:pseudaminic acid biosynthesis-associated methylase
MTTYKAQSDLWMGDYGDEYFDRNQLTTKTVATQVRVLERVLGTHRHSIATALEVGCGLGTNLVALQRICPGLIWSVPPDTPKQQSGRLFGVDINERAVVQAGKNSGAITEVQEATHLQFESSTINLVLTSGLLIHIPPSHLEQVISELYRVSNRYILIMEYFSRYATVIKHREKGRIWKRDYGSLMYKAHHVEVLDYGCTWNQLDGDDVNWWLFEKPAL